MAIETTLSTDVPAGSTPILSANFVDEDGDPITTLTSATATIFDPSSRQIVNNRLNADVSGSVTAGALSWTLAAGDTAALDPATDVEPRAVLIRWTWDSGARIGKHLIRLRIRNLDYVP